MFRFPPGARTATQRGALGYEYYSFGYVPLPTWGTGCILSGVENEVGYFGRKMRFIGNNVGYF